MSRIPAAILRALAIGLLLTTANGWTAVIPVTDTNLLAGLSPYNWVCRSGFIGSTVNGASLSLRCGGTRSVDLQVSSGHITTTVPGRFPILAWSVNGGPMQSQQLAAGETSVRLSTGVADPVIELYIKGFSPFEDRFSGELPPNSAKITGLAVDAGGKLLPPQLPSRIWLNFGDSILSGDGAAYAAGQGRPPDDAWAASDDGRASYGYLLAQHYGFREARVAYGGYDWGGGMAGVPSLETLIDQTTSTVSRLSDGRLSPSPDVILINLGENGAPGEESVIVALTRLRSRVKADAKILVMIPVSGRARKQIQMAFSQYQASHSDHSAYLIDLGTVTFATCDGQHPTAAGHAAIFKAALPRLDPILHPVK